MSMDTEKLVEYNPKLASINPSARAAYAKFKMTLIKREYDGLQEIGRQSFSVDRKSSQGKSKHFQNKKIFSQQSNRYIP